MAHLRRNCWPLHLVQQSSNLLQISKMRTVWVQYITSANIRRYGVDEDLRYTVRMHLEM